MMRAFSKVVAPMVGVFIVAATVIWLGPGTSSSYRVLAGLAGYIAIWTTCWVLALLAIARFTGYYATHNEVGSIVARTWRPAVPGAVRWVRRMMIVTPSRGRSRRYPVVFGMDADDRRVITIGAAFMRLQDVDRFLDATGLPTEGDWSAEVTRKQAVSLFPYARTVSPMQARRRVRMFVAGLAVVVGGSVGLAILMAVLVGR